MKEKLTIDAQMERIHAIGMRAWDKLDELFERDPEDFAKASLQAYAKTVCVGVRGHASEYATHIHAKVFEAKIGGLAAKAGRQLRMLPEIEAPKREKKR